MLLLLSLCSCFFSASVKGVSVRCLTNVNITLHPEINFSQTQNEGQLLIFVETIENGTLIGTLDINICDLCNSNLSVTVTSTKTSDSECIANS